MSELGAKSRHDCLNVEMPGEVVAHDSAAGVVPQCLAGGVSSSLLSAERRTLQEAQAISRATVEAVYSRFSGVYDLLFGIVAEQGRTSLAKELSSYRPERILEVGIGTGLMIPLYPTGSKVFGIDLCTAMLKRASSRAAKRPDLSVSLSRMDGERMSFPDGAFDCVVIPYVLSVTPDPRALIAEVRRVCSAGGLVLLLNHFRGSGCWTPLESIFRGACYKLGFRPDLSFEQCVEEQDWAVQAIRKVNLMDLSRLVVIRNRNR